MVVMSTDAPNVTRRRVAIVGASGYAGGEFLRLALQHPHLEVVAVTSERNAGQPVGVVHPNLRGTTQLRFRRLDELGTGDAIDWLVSALPHGRFASTFDALEPLAPKVVDLSADMRLRDPGTYRRTYGTDHPRPDLAKTFAYGVPEVDRNALQGATRIAGAGCIATATILALLPFVRLPCLARSEVFVDAKIGSSAAGASPGPGSHHPERSGAIRTYAPVGHRHGPEIEQALGGRLNVHLTATAVERIRGVHVTVQAFVQDGTSERDAWSAVRETFEDEPFVRVIAARKGVHRMPDPKILDGTNWCDVGLALEPDDGRLVIVSAIDNLVKGTAGGAIQSINVAEGWPETTGLTFAGLHP